MARGESAGIRIGKAKNTSAKSFRTDITGDGTNGDVVFPAHSTVHPRRSSGRSHHGKASNINKYKERVATYKQLLPCRAECDHESPAGQRPFGISASLVHNKTGPAL